jgi:hypothetical protein
MTQTKEQRENYIKALLEDKQRQSQEIMQLYAERRQLIITSEEALSRKQEREIAADRAKIQNEAIKDGIGIVKSLVPSVQIYLTKGKVGIAEGLKGFLDGLSKEVELALFGKWEDGKQLTEGILDTDQIKLVVGIVQGKIDPRKVVELLPNLRPEQLDAAQQLLRPDQLQLLAGLANAAGDVSAANGMS